MAFCTIRRSNILASRTASQALARKILLDQFPPFRWSSVVHGTLSLGTLGRTIRQNGADRGIDRTRHSGACDILHGVARIARKWQTIGFAFAINFAGAGRIADKIHARILDARRNWKTRCFDALNVLLIAHFSALALDTGTRILDALSRSVLKDNTLREVSGTTDGPAGARVLHANGIAVNIDLARTVLVANRIGARVLDAVSSAVLEDDTDWGFERTRHSSACDVIHRVSWIARQRQTIGIAFAVDFAGAGSIADKIHAGILDTCRHWKTRCCDALNVLLIAHFSVFAIDIGTWILDALSRSVLKNNTFREVAGATDSPTWV